MRFSIVAVLGLATFAAAQSSSANVTSASSSISRTATATSMSLSPVQTCLAACGLADICCQAKCVNVPCPSGSQANATTECAAKCPQGNGSKSDTDKYASCQASCVSSYFFSTGTAAAAATGSGASGASAATTTGTGSTASRTGSGSATATGASATQNAAPEIRFGAAGVGLVGLIIAGLAM